MSQFRLIAVLGCCWILLNGKSVQAQDAPALPSQESFLQAYDQEYARKNPWVFRAAPNLVYRSGQALPMPAIRMEPLDYLYAHGYSQTLSGTRCYMQQQTSARQFTYGPVGNPQ
ncbi:MAG: hypothetical protein KF690_02705, partial [Bacteroidetes bacterium]|nr:hypothetical protein [Bacteroidota bacterium]